MNPTLAVVIVALFIIAVYVIECWWFPFAKCWCCSGAGRHSRKDGKVWRDCLVCGGGGRRKRIGRRVWDYFTHL